MIRVIWWAVVASFVAGPAFAQDADLQKAWGTCQSHYVPGHPFPPEYAGCPVVMQKWRDAKAAADNDEAARRALIERLSK